MTPSPLSPDPKHCSGRRRRISRAAAAAGLAALSLAAAPAFAATAHDEATAPDPYEKLNRVMFYVNGALDYLVIRPAAITYKRVMPRIIRTGLRNAFSNMGEPTVAINDIFQGHGKKAVHTTLRFVENSTLGLGGLVDVAAQSGLPHHDNDFGVTLARRGVKSGPYLFLPILGPGTGRDAVGYLVTIGIDPFTYLRYPYSTPVNIARTVGRGLDERAAADKSIKAITASATDVYASIRSYYLQNREAEISGGKVDLNALPSFDESSGDQKNAEPPAGAAPSAPAPDVSQPATPEAAPSPAPANATSAPQSPAPTP